MSGARQLRCVGLARSFGGNRALDGVSFDLAGDERLRVVGANASGKTTLLNVLSGLLALDAGEIWLDEDRIDREAPQQRARRGIVRTFELDGLAAQLTAEDNVALGLWHGSLSDRRTRAREWLARFDLTEHASRLASELSVGQRRRVELARAFARLAELDGAGLALLDEPFRALDASARERVAEQIEAVLGRGSLILVEHFRDLAQRLTRSELWLKGGRIAQAAEEPAPPSEAPRPAPCASGALLLELQGIRAGYGVTEIVHGVDLMLHAGETVTLRGANGSGKTTLLRVAMGTLLPLRGTVSIFGARVRTPQARALKGVGYAPQGGLLAGHQTVAAHLQLASRVARWRGAPPDVWPAFQGAFPELEELCGRRAGDLSQGQKTLTALACAFATEPRVLIADEPFAGLAPELTRRALAFLEGVWTRADRATILVTHTETLERTRVVELVRGQLRVPGENL